MTIFGQVNLGENSTLSTVDITQQAERFKLGFTVIVAISSKLGYLNEHFNIFYEYGNE